MASRMLWRVVGAVVGEAIGEGGGGSGQELASGISVLIFKTTPQEVNRSFPASRAIMS
jgi:hypothetical protein